MDLAREFLVESFDFAICEAEMKAGMKVIFKPGSYYEGLVGVIQDMEDGKLMVRVGDSLRTHIEPSDVMPYNSDSVYA